MGPAPPHSPLPNIELHRGWRQGLGNALGVVPQLDAVAEELVHLLLRGADHGLPALLQLPDDSGAVLRYDGLRCITGQHTESERLKLKRSWVSPLCK